MSRVNPFGRHRQGAWMERAANPKLPDWLRVAGLAFAKHRANGHANFSQGEIANRLGKRSADGRLIPASGPTVSNAIKRAKDYGFIAETSHARCLVVPPHAVEGGLGSEYERCRFHEGVQLRWQGSVEKYVHVEDELVSCPA